MARGQINRIPFESTAKAVPVVIVDDTGAVHDPNGGASATRVALVTPDNGADLTGAPWRYVSFGGAGALKVTTSGGDTVTIPSGALAVGMQHLLNVVRVFATGTTATNIVVYK